MKTFKEYLAEISSVDEGLLDIFKKKKPKEPEKNIPISQEHRDMIKKHMPHNNADVIFSPGKYVLPHNVLAYHANARIDFHKKGDKLHAMVGHYRSSGDAQDPKVSPMIHSHHEINSESDLADLKKKLSS